MYNRKNHLILILIILSLLLCSCSNDDSYEKFENEFMDIYSQISKTINSKDIAISYQSIHSDEVKSKYGKIKQLIEKEKENISPKKEENFKKLSTWCQELGDIIENRTEWEALTTQEKRKMGNGMHLMVIRVTDWEDSKK